MKKLSFLLALILISLTCLGVAGRAHAATSVNDFTITNYQIDYTLSRDSDGRSALKTVEAIDAQFPASDQNHGIERAIPKTYDNHPTSLNILSVKNGSGAALHYSTHDSNDNLVVRIGDADTYVHGAQHYVITYTQRDVTRYFADTSSDEFYWDTNGTDWNVPISALAVHLHIQNGLQNQNTGKQQCYLGTAGSTDRCDLTAIDDGFKMQASDLASGENATIAIGFKPHSFAAYQKSLADKLLDVWKIALGATAVIALVLIIWFSTRYTRKSNRTAEHTTIIPEYVPPKDTSVSTSAAIYRTSLPTLSTQLIDFAVRGYIKIYQTREKSFFHRAEYELEITKDIQDLKAEEKELFNDLFPDTNVGTRLALADLKRRSSAVYASLQDNPRKLSKDIKGSYGLRAKDPRQSSWFTKAGLYCLVAAVLTLSPWLIVAALVALICAYTLYPLTDKGLALFHYLEGLKMYIKVAEEERIKMLQGPDTAEKIGAPVDANDKRQLVKLYEKVLPYAMIFGLEKAWNDRLGSYYETLNESPGWYAGNNAVFNAAVLSSAMSNFNTAVAYSAPSSSSSGGSGGGGSSGGGGGGGGGGGW